MYNLYILKCADNSLYTGITSDLDKHLSCHSNGGGQSMCVVDCRFV